MPVSSTPRSVLTRTQSLGLYCGFIPPHAPPAAGQGNASHGAAEEGLWRDDASDATLRLMDRKLEALDKARGHVADIAELAKQTKAHLEEGRFEDASACL